MWENRAGIKIRREMKILAVAAHPVLEFREQHIPVHRWRQRRNEPAIVPAHIRADNRRTREPAEAIRFQPFPPQRVLEILTFCRAKNRAHVRNLMIRSSAGKKNQRQCSLQPGAPEDDFKR